MGYLHIDNLYKAQEILAFKTCYALEKIHGTSAHIGWRGGRVIFHSGGESSERFKALFDEEKLTAAFAEKFQPEESVTIYGEAYGGKQQGMSKTYGKELKFIVFDVQVGEAWLAVPKAADLATSLEFEFVDFMEIPTELAAIDAERDKNSTQAIRNGVINEPKIREGIVLRPPFEVTLNNGKRVIAKHKREEFRERGKPAVDLDPIRREMLEGAEKIAEEWVTPMRLEHVIDRLISTRESKEIDIKDTKSIIDLMIEDVTREAEGEIADNPPARRAIGTRAAVMFKNKIKGSLYSKEEK